NIENNFPRFGDCTHSVSSSSTEMLAGNRFCPIISSAASAPVEVVFMAKYLRAVALGMVGTAIYVAGFWWTVRLLTGKRPPGVLLGMFVGVGILTSLVATRWVPATARKSAQPVQRTEGCER